MPNLFISYRRADSGASAELIHKRLVSWFGRERVFFDVEEIRAGEDWQRRLGERMDRCDAVLAIIGRGWLVDLDAGTRRLDDADDKVRWEIAQAFALGKRVLPLLVDGASLPDAADLPDSLKPLAGLQAIKIAHERRNKDLDTLVEELIGRHNLLDLFRYRLRLVKRAAIVIPAVALAGLAFAWVSLFDLFALDTASASYVMLLGDLVSDNRPDDALLLVTVPADPERAADKSQRQDLARLIEALSRRQAKRVVFDVFFRAGPASPFDAELLEAARAATAHGVEVIFGFNDFADGVPVSLPRLREVASGLGNVCVGLQRGVATLGSLVVSHGKADHPSLALLTALGPVTIKRIRDDTGEVEATDANGALRAVPFTRRETVSHSDARCPGLAPGDQVITLIAPLSPRERLASAQLRMDLAQALRGDADLHGRIVLVGLEDRLDELSTRLDAGARQRQGFEFQADVASAVLRGIAIRPLNPWGQWGIMLLLGTAAAGYRLSRFGGSGRWDWLVLVAVPLAYLIAAVIVYTQFRLLLNVVYHLTAFYVAYAVFARLERRWLNAPA